MSEVAANSYITKHQVDNRSGRKVDAQQWKQAEFLCIQQSVIQDNIQLEYDRSSRAKLKVEQSIITEKVKLKSPGKGKGKGASGSDEVGYAALAKAFGEILTVMGQGVSDQTEIFASEQKENQSNAVAVLDEQTISIHDRQKADGARDAAEAAQKKAEKCQTIMQWVSVGLACAVALSFVVVAAAPAISAAFASIQAALSAGTDAAGAGVVEMEMVDVTTFSQAAADTTGSSSASTSAAGGGVGAAAESEEASGWTVNEVLKNIGKRALSALGAVAMGSPQLVSYIESKNISGAENQLAKIQEDIGNKMATISLMQAGFTKGQKQIQQHSSVIQSLTEQLGEVVSTYSDMMKSVNAATQFATSI